MDSIIQSYINGYINCIKDLNNMLNHSITTNNNLNSCDDFINVFDDIMYFMHNKMNTLINVEKRTIQNEKRVKHKLHIIQGGKK